MKNISAAQRPFLFSLIGSTQFVLLTFVAMLLYPGGTLAEETTRGYTFTANFFSDLGLTIAHNREPNTLSAILFFIALTVAGLGLCVYFVATPKFFKRSPAQRALSLLGSFFGILSGLSYVGIAFTPANLAGETHLLFVQLAFSTFLVAVLCYIPAVLLNGNFANVYAAVYAIFAVCLIVYLWLLFGRPFGSGESALVINVVGQKLIVYAAIICMGIQSYGAFQLAGNMITAVPAMAD